LTFTTNLAFVFKNTIMSSVKTTIIVLILSIISQNLFSQNMDACYYQIADKDKQLYRITEGEKHLNYQKMDFQFDVPVYLLAFNQKKKELLGISKKGELLKLNDAGKIDEKIILENIDNAEYLLIAITDKKQNLYLAHSNLSSIYKIDLNNTNKVTKLSARLDHDIYDLAYQKKANTFWSVNDKGHLVGLSTKDFELTSTTELGVPKGCYGSVWFDGEETIYAHHNESAKIYHINLTTKQATIKDSAPFFGDWNDGTACYKGSKIRANKVNSNPVLSSAQLKQSLNISEIELFPNPNQGKFKVYYKGLNKPNAEWIVADITGKIIYQSGFNELEEIQLKNVAPGNYIIQLVEDEEVIDHKKFVVH